MRDWNRCVVKINGTDTLVCRIPMRDWNNNSSNLLIGPSRVCRIPMRDWNLFLLLQSQRIFVLFVEYLWGIETKKFENNLKLYIFVCRIPMRDWNSCASCCIRTALLVCRIPMRDWNLFLLLQSQRIFVLFVEYLWGIETKKFENNLKLYIFVCRIPMRDWNFQAVAFKYFNPLCL